MLFTFAHAYLQRRFWALGTRLWCWLGSLRAGLALGTIVRWPTRVPAKSQYFTAKLLVLRQNCYSYGKTEIKNHGKTEMLFLKVLFDGSLVTLSYLGYLKVAPYSFLKSGKHIFQTHNRVHWYFVRRMKLNIWYRTAFWESETATKKCVTVVAMATKTFQNCC